MQARNRNSKLWLLAKLVVGALLLSLTLGLTACCIKFVIEPGYKNPLSRMYTSRLGYASVIRQRNQAFPVTTARATRRTIEASYLGEGMIQSEPVLVAVIPTGTISHVYVQEGATVTKGELLAELDTTRAKHRLETAQITLAAAKLEYERIKIGTHYQHAQERPAQDAIRLKAAAYEAAARKELATILEKLSDQKLVARAELLKNNIQRVQAQANMREAQQALSVAEKGHQHSLQIAKAAVRRATIAAEEAEQTLREHKIYAAVDGVVERCLVHQGEYIQASGKPAFLLAAGQWFEAHFDQSSINRFAVGDRAKVTLEAHAGHHFIGRVTQILRIVSYNRGGPEINRPLRHLGTGAPEWPATFSVRIALDPQAFDKHHLPNEIVPGLTGFARTTTRRVVMAVPDAALVSVTGNKGLVYLAQSDRFLPREVTVGQKSNGWTEIRAGLELDDSVIVSGHQVLEPDDQIVVESSEQETEKTESQLVKK